LDRNHGLVGEGLQQLHVVLGERAGLDARDADRANGAAVAPEGDLHPAAKAPRTRYIPDAGSCLRLGLGIPDL
jgi:hypothetical protein